MPFKLYGLLERGLPVGSGSTTTFACTSGNNGSCGSDYSSATSNDGG